MDMTIVRIVGRSALSLASTSDTLQGYCDIRRRENGVETVSGIDGVCRVLRTLLHIDHRARSLERGHTSFILPVVPLLALFFSRLFSFSVPHSPANLLYRRPRSFTDTFPDECMRDVCPKTVEAVCGGIRRLGGKTREGASLPGCSSAV